MRAREKYPTTQYYIQAVTPSSRSAAAAAAVAVATVVALATLRFYNFHLLLCSHLFCSHFSSFVWLRACTNTLWTTMSTTTSMATTTMPMICRTSRKKTHFFVEMEAKSRWTSVGAATKKDPTKWPSGIRMSKWALACFVWNIRWVERWYSISSSSKWPWRRDSRAPTRHQQHTHAYTHNVPRKKWTMRTYTNKKCCESKKRSRKSSIWVDTRRISSEIEKGKRRERTRKDRKFEKAKKREFIRVSATRRTGICESCVCVRVCHACAAVEAEHIQHILVYTHRWWPMSCEQYIYSEEWISSRAQRITKNATKKTKRRNRMETREALSHTKKKISLCRRCSRVSPYCLTSACLVIL